MRFRGTTLIGANTLRPLESRCIGRSRLRLRGLLRCIKNATCFPFTVRLPGEFSLYPSQGVQPGLAPSPVAVYGPAYYSGSKPFYLHL